MSHDVAALFGLVISDAELALPKARGVVQYARGADYVRLVECRRREDGTETVVCDLDIELAQRPVNPIAPTERVAVSFTTADLTYPDVVSLRHDFPDVIHLNARPPGQPKSFCLYLEPYEQLRLHWTAHLFVERIRTWLAMTADATLHPEDQALEPLVFQPHGTLVVPRELVLATQTPLAPYTVHAVDPNETRSVWIVSKRELPKEAKRAFVAACFEFPPQTHGLIRSAPSDLAELQEFLLPTGVDIVKEARDLVGKWKAADAFAQLEAAKLFLILQLPKRRVETGNVEVVERLAFLCDCTLKELDERLATFELTHGYSGAIAIPESVQQRANIKVLCFDVTEEFSLVGAARLSGFHAEGGPFCLLGAGALGSQILDTLLRGGVGPWTVIDNDRLLPHNLARHRLTGSFLGWKKATAMSHFANDLAPGTASALCIDVLRPGDERQGLDSVTEGVPVVCDCTASVPVGRAIAAGEIKTQRCVSLFLNPSGTALVFLAEDRGRRCRVDWLEMQYYREIAGSPQLLDHLRTASTTRYSNTCRDVTARVPQDAVALFASIGSRAFRQALSSDAPQISVWRLDGAFEVRRIDVASEPVIELRMADWKICTDSHLLHSVSTFRQFRLPNETGGVLLGSYDMQRRIIYVVAMLPSPPDSEEWPTSYKRGSAGLATAVEDIVDRTLLNLEYVGEWHSHPAGAGTNMSDTDKVAMKEISGEMAKAGLPGLMLIAADNGSYAVHLAEA
jgi:hypothetical protein